MNNKNYFYWLDWLRFIAAFLVLANHYRTSFFVAFGDLLSSQQNIFTSIFYAITRLGHESVLIFFVLSGFLVGGRALERISNKTVNLQSYIIDRSVRIIIPLIASIVLVVIVCLITNNKIPYFDILGSLFSLQGILTQPIIFNSPLWSLSYEVWFYVLMGAIMCISSTRRKGYFIISFLTIIITFIVFLKLKVLYLFIWLLGALAYLYTQSFLRQYNERKFSSLKIVINIVVLLGLIMLLQINGDSNSIKTLSFFNTDIIELLIALSVCVLIHSLVEKQPTKSIWLRLNNIGSILANFSYTLYLVHRPIESLLQIYVFPKSSSVNIHSIINYILALIIALISSYIIYLLSEKNTHKLKIYIKKHLQSTL